MRLRLILVAIVLNGGYMPADAGAMAALGKTAPTTYSNSAIVAEPVLKPLTDIFALPTWVPSTRSSIGDVLISVGVVVVIVAATVASGRRARLGLTAVARALNPAPSHWLNQSIVSISPASSSSSARRSRAAPAVTGDLRRARVPVAAAASGAPAQCASPSIALRATMYASIEAAMMFGPRASPSYSPCRARPRPAAARSGR